MEAKNLGRQQDKDIFLLFDSSDDSPFSRALADEVFAQPSRWKRLAERFVFVHVDFPKYPTATRRVRDASRNRNLQAQFFANPGYPRVVLLDAEGRPFAERTGYPSGTADEYVASMVKAVQVRVDRDELLAAVKRASDAEKLPAARRALEFMSEKIEAPSARGDGTYILDLHKFYGSQLAELRELADRLDAENRAGYREWFFWNDWYRRAKHALAAGTTDQATLRALADEVDAWTVRSQFRKTNFGVSLLAKQAEILGLLKDVQGRERAIRAALALEPSPAWRKALNAKLLGAGTAVGKTAPEISGEDIDGKSFKLSDYRGKVVLLDFWGNW